MSTTAHEIVPPQSRDPEGTPGTLPIANRLYLTTVDAEPPGDTFMPEFDLTEWRETQVEHHPADDKHPHAYRVAVLEREPAPAHPHSTTQ